MDKPANITYFGSPRQKEQTKQSLALANSIRFARARLAKDFATLPYEQALELFADTLDVMPPEAVNWTVFDSVTSFHRMGRTRTLRLLQALGEWDDVWITETKTLGSLTPRQQRALVGGLRCALLPDRRRAA